MKKNNDSKSVINLFKESEIPYFFNPSSVPHSELLSRSITLLQFRLIANSESLDDDLEMSWIVFKDQWEKVKNEVEAYILTSEN